MGDAGQPEMLHQIGSRPINHAARNNALKNLRQLLQSTDAAEKWIAAKQLVSTDTGQPDFDAKFSCSLRHKIGVVSVGGRLVHRAEKIVQSSQKQIVGNQLPDGDTVECTRRNLNKVVFRKLLIWKIQGDRSDRCLLQ